MVYLAVFDHTHTASNPSPAVASRVAIPQIQWLFTTIVPSVWTFR